MGNKSQHRAGGGEERCGRKKKDGTGCNQPAGMGTDHVGYGACRFHAGNAPGQRKQAIKAMAVHEGNRYAMREEFPILPEDALLWAVRLSAGSVQWLRSQVERDDYWGTTPHQREDLEKVEKSRQAWFREYGEERDRLARTAKMAVDAGVARRQVELAEAEAAFVFEGLMAALRAIKATPAQMDAAGAALLQYLESTQAPVGEIRREITVGRR